MFFKVLERVLNSIVEKLIICKNFLFSTFVLLTRFCMKSLVSLILNNGVIILRITMVMITSFFCYFVFKSVKPNIIPYKEIILMFFCFFLILVVYDIVKLGYFAIYLAFLFRFLLRLLLSLENMATTSLALSSLRFWRFSALILLFCLCKQRTY